MQFSWKSAEEDWKCLRSFVSQQFMLLWKRLRAWENCLEKMVAAKGANSSLHLWLVPSLPTWTVGSCLSMAAVVS